MSEPTTRNVGTYTVFMEYFATGEGVTIEVSVLLAPDAQHAREAHLTLHGYEGEARDYFGVGVEVHEGVDAAVLGRWLTPGFVTALQRTVRYGEFKFRWHFNMS